MSFQAEEMGAMGSVRWISLTQPSYIVLIEAFHTPTLILNAVVVRERGGGF